MKNLLRSMFEVHLNIHTLLFIESDLMKKIDYSQMIFARVKPVKKFDILNTSCIFIIIQCRFRGFYLLNICSHKMNFKN